MIPEPWTYVSLGLLVALHVSIVLYVVYVHRERSAEAALGSEESAGDVVACEECGTENEPGYRFCRDCLAELPGAEVPSSVPGAPAGRGIL